MSPEQAAAAHRRVDHRTDLFSLSATLYELLTTQPAFLGSTPHDVIQRILTTEPVPIRRLVHSVPRDLETIVMKSLAKDPCGRYNAASELAADLRAYLDGRPIRARRVGFAERSVRWVKRQQQSVKLAATAVAVTLLVTLASGLGWYGYQGWRQAALKLNAAAAPLVVEIFDSNDQLVRVETAPMQNAIDLPAADYRLRVNADGKLSETFALSLTRGRESEFDLDLHDQLLWTPGDLERAFDVVDFGAEQGVVLWNEQGVGLRRQVPPLGWTRELSAGHLPNADQSPGFRWPWNLDTHEHSGYGPFDARPWVAPRSVDIDGRGLGDLILAGRHQAWLMAISGDDGTILWFTPRGHDSSDPSAADANPRGRGVSSAIIGVPICDHDYDADGTLDLIVTIADLGPQPTLLRDRYQTKFSVEAVSGKTGESIWSYEIPREYFELPTGQAVPYDLRWFAGTSGGTRGGGGGSMNLGRHRVRDGSQQFERTGPHGYRPASVSLISAAGNSRLAIVAGTQLIILDPTTGKAEGQPIELPARPGLTCQWDDADGDGNSDLVLIERIEGSNRFVTPVSARLVVWSLAKQRSLWTKKLDAHWPQQPTWTVAAPQWPLVVDLNGDDQCEIIVPDGRSGGNNGGGGFAAIPWGVVAVLAGSSGEPLWTRRLVSMDQQVDHFLAGPDLDQDGYRELYTVTLAGSEFHSYINALSGRSGDTLWTNSMSIPPDRNSSVEYHLMPPMWWRSGADGWPTLLAQAVEGGYGSRRSLVGAFSAGTGRVAHIGRNITAMRPADLDGDHTDDLLIYASRVPSALDRGGKLHCLRGVAQEKWVSLGNAGDPIADFDGDGTRDLLNRSFDGTLTAISGASGAILWRTPISPDGRQVEIRPAASLAGVNGDLDGDGIDDMLGWTHVSHNRRRDAPFFAVSGRTGRKLWVASEISIQMLSGVCAAEAHDLDGDGKPEVLWLAALDYDYPLRVNTSSHESQFWLFVTSGQTGKLRWSHPLSSPYGQSPGSSMHINFSHQEVSPTVGDINGDGTADIVVPEILPDGQSLRTVALSGSDGSALWTRRCPTNPMQQTSLQDWVPPTVGDLDGDGRSEVVVVEITNFDLAGNTIRPRYRVVTVNGRDGSEIWDWISDSESSYWQPFFGESKGKLTRAKLLRTGGPQRRVAVLLPGNMAAIAVLSSDGIPHQREASNQTSVAGIWPCDVNGDGVDELVFLDQSTVHVASAERLDEPLWTRSLDSLGHHRILGVVDSPTQPSPVIAVARSGSDNSVLGFDAATGRRVWSCPGLISRDADGSTYLIPDQIALLDAGVEPPHVYYQYGAVSRCRVASLSRPADSAPTPRESTVSWVEKNPPSAVRASLRTAAGYRAGNDDRWARDLPWVPHHAQSREIVRLIVWSLVFAVLMVVLPIGSLVYLVKDRRFNLRTLLTVPIVTGLFLAACLAQAPVERDFEGFFPRLWLAAIFSPVIVAFGMAARWMARGQWRHTVSWIAIVVVASGLCASLSLWAAGHQNPSLPEVHYDFTGWYLIVLMGAYLACWMLVIGFPCTQFAGWIRRRFRRNDQSRQPGDQPEPERTLAVKITSSP